jgi:hypothetical protein
MQTYQIPDNSNPLESKADRWKSQAIRVFESLKESPKTRLQVAYYTNTPIQNVCRFVGTLRKLGQVCVVKVDRDPISKMKAEYLSVDERICHQCGVGKQLSMF